MNPDNSAPTGSRTLDQRISGLVVEDPDRFRVHSDVYVDPQIFGLEMDRIFDGAWVFVAHESMIPESG